MRNTNALHNSNMKISRYGISLERIKQEHCEMLRLWRNDPKISRNMFHHGIITAEMQTEWFSNVNNYQNFFFLIQYHSKQVGLINMSSIDWNEHTAFSGLFIYDDNYLGTDVPVRASLTVLDVFFLLGGIKKVFAKIREDNLVAHRYNTQLGFVKQRKIELGQGFEYELKQSDYFSATEKLRKLAAKEQNETVIEFENSDLDMELRNMLLTNVSEVAREKLQLEVE